MRNIFKYDIAVSALFILFSCKSNIHENKIQEPIPPKLEHTSQQIFESNCAACHGNDGTAGISGAANLQTSQLSVDAIQQRITNGKNDMPAFKEMLTTTQIQQLTDYVKTLHN